MVFVLKNGVVVGVHADSVGEHLLLVVEESISTEVISEIHTFVDCGTSGSATTADARRYDAVCVASHGFLVRERERERDGFRATSLIRVCLWAFYL